MALTLRGWWLSRKSADCWSLQVPIYKPIPGEECGVRFVKHEELTVPEEILERLGLTQHAELYKAGKSTNMEKLLKQAGVIVCAPISSEQTNFSLSGGPVANDDSA